MEQQMDLSALDGRNIDPETFRRVWARVMPNQENSPVVLDIGGQEQPRREETKPPRREAEERAPEKTEREKPGTEERLRRLMDMAWAGAGAGSALARRMGNRDQRLTGLAADHRRALRQLAAAYFLATGRRHRPRGEAPSRGGDLSLALREQFLWEQRWAAACLEAAKEAEDPALEELCRELAQDAGLHQRGIRAVLEQM